MRAAWWAILAILMCGVLLALNQPTKAQTATDTPTPTPAVTDTPTTTETPTATPTATPNLLAVSTLTSGQAVAVVYTISAGESLISVLLVILIGLVIFGLFITLVERK